MRLAPGLQRGLLRFQVLEGEVALPAGGEKRAEGDYEEEDERELGAAQTASAPPQEEPCPAVQP
jgi:hypothetical protein